AGTIGLIIVAIVGLEIGAKINVVLGVQLVIKTSAVAILKKWSRNHSGRICADRFREGQFGKCGWIFRQAGVFTLTLVCEEREDLVLYDWSADAATELLTAIRRIYQAAVSLLLIFIESLITEEAEGRTVVLVRARLGDHVDGGAFGAAVGGRETLRRNREFLHGFQRKLHDRTTDGVVLVVHTIVSVVVIEPRSST